LSKKNIPRKEKKKIKSEGARQGKKRKICESVEVTAKGKGAWRENPPGSKGKRKTSVFLRVQKSKKNREGRGQTFKHRLYNIHWKEEGGRRLVKLIGERNKRFIGERKGTSLCREPGEALSNLCKGSNAQALSRRVWLTGETYKKQSITARAKD